MKRPKGKLFAGFGKNTENEKIVKVGGLMTKKRGACEWSLLFFYLKKKRFTVITDKIKEKMYIEKLDNGLEVYLCGCSSVG